MIDAHELLWTLRFVAALLMFLLLGAIAMSQVFDSLKATVTAASLRIVENTAEIAKLTAANTSLTAEVARLTAEAGTPDPELAALDAQLTGALNAPAPAAT